jgi:hypothetical protein
MDLTTLVLITILIPLALAETVALTGEPAKPDTEPQPNKPDHTAEDLGHIDEAGDELVASSEEGKKKSLGQHLMEFGLKVLAWSWHCFERALLLLIALLILTGFKRLFGMH